MQTSQLPYVPSDWYWLDGTGRIFATKSASLVASTDAGYLAWLAVNGAPSPWPKDGSGAQTGAALNAVLSPFGLSCGVTP